jgi:cytoskeletal protein CcmA (bactofilin family)
MQSAKKQAVVGRTLDSSIRFTSLIGESSTFTGSFSGGENIVVRGQVQGEGDVQGAVVIADSGHWLGQLKADIVVVAGKVDGDITAREKIEVLNGAHIKGNLDSPVIAMETGAIHEGRLSMHS